MLYRFPFHQNRQLVRRRTASTNQARSLGRARALSQRLTDLLQAFGQLALKAAVDRAIVFALDAEIVLRRDGVGRVVGIFVAFAVAKTLRAGVMRVLQMTGTGSSRAFDARRADRFADGDVEALISVRRQDRSRLGPT